MNEPAKTREKSPLPLLIVLMMLAILVTAILSNLEKFRKNVVFDETAPVPEMPQSFSASPFPQIQTESRTGNPADVPDVSSFLKKGYNFWNQKNLAAAENEFRTALVFDPDNAIALSYMGAILFMRGEYKASEYMFRRETVAYPSNSYAFRNLSMALFRQNKLNDAISEAKRAYALDSESEENTLYLAKLYAYSGDKWAMLAYLHRLKRDSKSELQELLSNPIFQPYQQDSDFLRLFETEPEKAAVEK